MKKFSVLYLEDNPFDVELVKNILNKEGFDYEMIVVDRKNELIKILKKNKFDIILADYSLPSFNGLEVLNIVKDMKTFIPFVFVSGEMGEEIAIESLKMGATDYVLKSQMKRLGSSIVRALNESEEIKKRKLAENQALESYEKLRKVFDEIVGAFSSLAEKRDPYTAKHHRNVAKLACAIAEEMKLSKEIIEGLNIAALLHDIGKIYVPAEILNKPGELTTLEFDIIKTHSQVGYDILKSIEFPWPVAKIVLQHHERLNGSGYPNGLKGKDIILETRILSIADAIEAMASHRPYRTNKLDVDKALEIIVKGENKFFDKDIIENYKNYFKKNKEQVKNIFN